MMIESPSVQRKLDLPTLIDEGSGQPLQSASATCKSRFVHPHVVQHAEIKIGQRNVVVLVEREVLAVAEAAAREDDRQVFVVVDVGIAHVAAIEHHGAIQPPVSDTSAMEIAEKSCMNTPVILTSGKIWPHTDNPKLQSLT